MNEPLFWIAPTASIVALVFAAVFFKQMMAADEGTDLMKKIGKHVREGAMAYLNQQYKIMLIVFVVVTILFAVLAYGFDLQSNWLPITFVCGGFFSALAGYFGMRTATQAATRTAAAARESLSGALKVSFRSGAVMGLVVVGLGLLNISFWFFLINAKLGGEGGNLMMVTTTALTFSIGASLQALFARVGGGIFTKAADVGADLVGKVEAGIPEDDPRNPAVIADNVGDNVGDVAGMGADLFESYCGSILAACALGAAAYVGPDEADTAMQMKAVVAPMLIAGIGILLSIIGVFLVRTKEGATQKDLLESLSLGINVSSVLILIAAAIILQVLGINNPWGIWGAVAAGLITGIVIGKATEYYTSATFKPTKSIAEQAKGGAATIIISGVSVGMISTCIPVLAVCIGTAVAFYCGSGFDLTNLNEGLYGIAIAAVGMLSTLGITLATDAYGPIADNAGGNAEMAGLGPEVRERTDALDSLGNTTAATGKGFAIGSAALTALALLASYIEVIRIELVKSGLEALRNGVPVAEAQLKDFMNHYDVTLLNPMVLISIFIGAMVAFLFCGMTVAAVGKAAGLMVEEVRRQFREDDGILKGTKEPDYKSCVSISTLGAQKEMILPSLIAIIIPIVIGILFGVAGVIGLLVGGLSSGFVLAVFLANSGGAWDNAKKYIEEGHHGGKSSAAHKASVIGDTVGDPFKDTSGPSLNILIKLMSIVAIAMAGVTVAWSLIG